MAVTRPLHDRYSAGGRELLARLEFEEAALQDQLAAEAARVGREGRDNVGGGYRWNSEQPDEIELG